MTMKFCPMKFNRPNPDDWGCEGCGCAWWDESIGVCGIILQPHLKGLEVERQEMRAEHEAEAMI